MMNVNLNSPAELRQAGMLALAEALGPVGVARFIQQFDSGSGDYTKEKYEQPELSIEEIVAAIKAVG